MPYAMEEITLDELTCFQVRVLSSDDEPAIGWIIYDPNTGWGWKYPEDEVSEAWRFATPLYKNPGSAIEELEKGE